MWRALVAACLVAMATAQINDLTRVAGASGSEVVEAVVSLLREACIFPDDHLFLRRLAYVETKDGTDPKTYRPGYDGGIWQVDKSVFDKTKTNPTLFNLYTEIANRYGIDWNRVTYADLRKPLYSGLAAALYLQMNQGPGGLPRRMEDQGAFYMQYFRNTDRNAAYNYNKLSQTLEIGCQTSTLDLVFVVDSSASISYDDFNRAKKFTSDVTDRFNVGTNDVRIAYVTFSTSYQLQFYLNRYSTKDQAKSAIAAIQKKDGGTDTDQALNFVANDVLSPGNGARVGAATVVVLITDGKSADSQRTLAAAKVLRDQGVLVFAIGVGDGVDGGELGQVASAPNCTHVVLLSGYSDLDSLIAQMQQVSCRAPTVLHPGTYTYPCYQSNNFQIPSNLDAMTTVSVTDGSIDVYGSFVNPRPNKAFNEFNASSVPATSSLVFVTHETRPLFLNVSTSPGALRCLGNYSITVSGPRNVQPGWNFVCVANGIAQPCSAIDILNYLYNPVILTTNLGFPSPCRVGFPGYYAYPFSNDRFVYCDAQGRSYLVACKPHTHFELSAFGCVNGDPTVFSVPSSSQPTLPPVTPRPTQGSGYNPCTQDNLEKGLFFFPYPGDDSKFIECTEFPLVGYVKNCPPDHRWDQEDLSCVWNKMVVDPSTPNPVFDLKANNPCHRGMQLGDVFHYPYPPDKHRFIQCDTFGQAFVKDCPTKPGTGQEIWNDILKTCVLEIGIYPGSTNHP